MAGFPYYGPNVKARTPELLPIASMQQDGGVPQNHLALVSPCSTCRNFLSEADDTYPACPRRYWQARAEAIRASGATGEEAPADYLLRKGRSDDASGYENPVAWVQGQCRIVWCATLDENRAILRSDGTLANPDILSEGFDTKFLTCRTMPYLPLSREANYYGGEQLHEGDFVLLTSVKFPQMDSNNPGTPVRIGGFAAKLTPMQKAVLTPAKKTVNAQGF